MIILASNSPRRKELMAFGGWSFVVHPASVDERVKLQELPADYVRRLSNEKAQAAYSSLGSNPLYAAATIVSADTAVVLTLRDEDLETASLLPEFPIGKFDQNFRHLILGKPNDAEHAGRVLRLLRGRTHQVYSGITAMQVDGGQLESLVCITDVPMRNYKDDEIKAYIESGDPFDKAGAYAIQHPGFHPVQELHGCYANVMGLPVCHLVNLLKKFGISSQKDISSKCLKKFAYDCPISGCVLDGVCNE